MKNILVPTDFSPCAQRAIDFAVHAASYIPAKIILYHAFDLQGDIYTDYMGVTKEYNQELYNNVVRKLTAVKDGIAKTFNTDVDVLISKNSFQKTIKKVAKENDINLIIMGTLGGSGISNILFGSNTSFAIGNSYVPVLAIPDRYKWRKPERILFATNHFEDNSYTLDFLFEIANLFMAKVDAGVFTNEGKDRRELVAVHSHESPEYEARLRRKYNEPALTVTQIFGDDFIDAMQDFIDKNEIDMLAMFTHKRTFPDKIFNPSITRKMSYHTRIPLLAIPGRA